MQNKIWLSILMLSLLVLTACNGDENIEDTEEDSEIIQVLEVDLSVPEEADVEEKVELTALVTYGEEKVNDADEIEFELWEEGNKEDSIKLEAINNNDGTYSTETAFDKDGIFTVQVHVTARDLHTMPQQSITVGEGDTHQHNDEDEHSEHVQGFGMHFVKPENPRAEDEIELMVHLQMDDETLESAEVQYEIWNYDISENHVWENAEEAKPGEYIASHTFRNSGNYTIQIHVENDDGLHEHEKYQIDVIK
ncbi:FixH family protein [Virgibacillus sp. C22-A2]|uniref:FixH family protein n=1 Tax=Virgibacillus tibetensis TaxID=3042313 RepID=A0ABU6KKG1_9BACI|nr:FixH family protein [Virgibacillus sp. C22-A2]